MVAKRSLTRTMIPQDIDSFSTRELRLLTKLSQLERQVQELQQRNEALVEHQVREWIAVHGPFTGRWTTMEERRQVVSYVERWVELSGVSRLRFTQWLGISESKFFTWKRQVLDAGFEDMETDAAQ